MTRSHQFTDLRLPLQAAFSSVFRLAQWNLVRYLMAGRRLLKLDKRCSGARIWNENVADDHVCFITAPIIAMVIFF